MYRRSTALFSTITCTLMPAAAPSATLRILRRLPFATWSHFPSSLELSDRASLINQGSIDRNDDNVSRRWHHTLRDWLRSGHARTRSRPRIRAVRHLAIHERQRRERPLPPSTSILRHFALPTFEPSSSCQRATERSIEHRPHVPPYPPSPCRATRDTTSTPLRTKAPPTRSDTHIESNEPVIDGCEGTDVLSAATFLLRALQAADCKWSSLLSEPAGS